MSSRIWRLFICLALMTAAYTMPTTAKARDGYFVIPASRSSEFRLKGSDGYSISVFGSHSQVSLAASGHHASVSYTTSGLVSSKWMKARFGRLGRISVRFHPSGPPRLVRPAGNCRGKGKLVEAGRFVGTIVFEGENGYTAVHTSRTRGRMVRTSKQVCSNTGEGGDGGGTFHWTILSASSESNGIFFTAFKIASKAHPALDGTGFEAMIIEIPSRKLTILRSISTDADLNAFATTESGGRITSATITPPAPFTGSATFQKVKGSHGTWTGSLAGNFPGRGEVGLAGPEFSAEILH
jgi:hypothetical protein